MIAYRALSAFGRLRTMVQTGPSRSIKSSSSTLADDVMERTKGGYSLVAQRLMRARPSIAEPLRRTLAETVRTF
jgi:hypothetical protein